MLLALGRFEPVRDILMRLFSQQNPDGDWPQWFMFFDRERGIRPGDSHGDIVYWPVLALAQYLLATEDAGLLDEQMPFFHPEGDQKAEQATLWQHVERALAVMHKPGHPGHAALRPTATATGTIRCSPCSPACASTCAAPGP